MRKFTLRQALYLLVCVALFAGIVYFIHPLLFQRNQGAEPVTPQNAKALRHFTGLFETTAHITYRDLSAIARIVQDTPEACTVTFSAPDTLKNMSFVFRQDQVKVSYRGLSFDFDPGSIPGSAVAKAAVSSINAALQKEGLALEQLSGSLSLTGSSESGDFTLLIDTESGDLLKLTVPSQELEIAFENFTFL